MSAATTFIAAWLRRRRRGLLAVSLLLALVGTSPLHTPLNNPNEGVRVYTVKALVEQHTFVINDVQRAWGFIDDKSVVDGRLYQSKAPLVSLLGAAAYALVHPFTGDLSRPALTRLCRVAGNVVPTLLMLGLLAWRWRLHRPVSEKDKTNDDNDNDNDNDDEDEDDNDDDDSDDVWALRALILVGLAVGSGVLASLHVFSGHAIAALAPAVAMALWRPLPRDQSPRRRTILAAVVLVAATCAEYPAALCLPLLLPLLWQCFRARASAKDFTVDVIVVGIAGVITALPTMIAHTICFGAPWQTGYRFLESAAYRPLVEGTTFGIGAPDPAVWAAVLFSPSVGLFFFTPLCVLGVVGMLQRLRRSRLEGVVVVVVVVLLLLFIAGFRGWRGGWSVGPRYILELVGIFGVLAVDGARVLPARFRVVVVAILVGAGVLHSGVAGAFFPHLPELFDAPVGQLMLPLVVRGYSPDGLWLLLTSKVGAAPPLAASLAAILAAVALFVPVLLPIAVGASRRGQVIVPVAVGLLAVCEVQTAPVRPAAGLEVRRLTDNWRPEAGNPDLAPFLGAALPDAVAWAIDRGRVAHQPPSCVEPARPRRRDVGPGVDAVRAAVDAASAGQLVVVDDALAGHIAPAGGGSLVLARHDLEGGGRRPVARPLPCQAASDTDEGEVFVVRPAGGDANRWASASLGRFRPGPALATVDGFVVERWRAPASATP